MNETQIEFLAQLIFETRKWLDNNRESYKVDLKKWHENKARLSTLEYVCLGFGCMHRVNEKVAQLVENKEVTNS
jgi:hypothetical protein